MRSQDDLRRLLAEVPYLRAHQGSSLAGVARTFNISEAQLMKDLGVLWMCGLPGGLPDDLIEIDMDAARDEGVIRLANADFLSRPMRFTPDEATSLLVALKAVAEVATGELARAAQRASDKLRGIVPEAAPERVGIQLASGSSTVRESLRRAIDGHRRIVLEYDNASRDETTRPTVDPYSIEVRSGIAYLHAFAVETAAADRQGGRGVGWRLYRLERIVSVRTSGEPAGDHGAPPADHHWPDEHAPEVTLDLAPQAHWVVEYYPTTSVETLPGPDSAAGTVLRARLRVGSPAWLTGLLLRLGDGVLRVDPPAAAEQASQVAREALALNASALAAGE